MAVRTYGDKGVGMAIKRTYDDGCAAAQAQKSPTVRPVDGKCHSIWLQLERSQIRVLPSVASEGAVSPFPGFQQVLRNQSGVEAADEETTFAAKDEAEPEFRAILDEMSPPRRAAFVALCKEPTDEPHSRTYMRRHGIKGSGALKSAFDGLEASGYLERGSPGTQPRPTDLLLAIWIRERMNGS